MADRKAACSPEPMIDLASVPFFPPSRTRTRHPWTRPCLPLHVACQYSLSSPTRHSFGTQCSLSSIFLVRLFHIMASTGPPQNLPLDDRSDSLKIPIIVLIVLSSIFVILRLGVSFRNRNFTLLTDHFLWTGHVSTIHKSAKSKTRTDPKQALAIAGAICCYIMAKYGGGRHIWDPVLQNPANLEKYMRYLWTGQLLNLYGMALVKLSICAYIFMLNFSKSFRILIWVSVVVHVGLNFIFPTIILFGECTPYTKHWDITGTQPGSCWSTKPKVISGMIIIESNLQ
jgi:hypothetical protein